MHNKTTLSVEKHNNVNFKGLMDIELSTNNKRKISVQVNVLLFELNQ